MTWIDLLAVASAAALCALWVLVQRWVSAYDPCQPGVEGQCGCKGAAAASATCRRRPPTVTPGLPPAPRSPEEAAQRPSPRARSAAHRGIVPP